MVAVKTISKFIVKPWIKTYGKRRYLWKTGDKLVRKEFITNDINSLITKDLNVIGNCIENAGACLLSKSTQWFSQYQKKTTNQ